MASKIEFISKNKEELKEFILKNQEGKTIFNFLNLYSVYLYKNNKEFRKSIDVMKKNSINLVDSSTISILFRTKRLRGTDFTKFLIKDLELLKNKRHFFIGFEEKDLKILSETFGLEKRHLFSYNPPYIKEDKFSKKEIEKIVKLINKNQIDYLWIGVGNPKQEILALDLYDKVNVICIFNTGAAFDFITGKKKESPKIFQKLGIEWLYRFITDFKHSRKKVWRSFIGLIYLPKIVKIRNSK